MDVVHKTTLNLDGIQDIEVPEGAEFLHIASQGGNITIWYRCNPNHPPIKWRILIIGTGQDIPDDAEYLGTVLQLDGFAWHVFAMWPDEAA